MKKKVIVIGGGFAGLTTAYYLSRGGFSVEVHEKSYSWGGLIQTHHTEFGLIETAANGLLKTQALVELCREVGVSLMEAGDRSKKRFIYRRGAPRRWPLSGAETLRLLPSALSLLINKSRKKPKPTQKLSHWVEQTLNATALNYLVAPALQGVYADDPENMSACLVMDRFFTPKKNPFAKTPLFVSSGQINPFGYSSFSEKKVKSCTVAPKKGMGELVERLVGWLSQNRVALYLNSDYMLPTKLNCPHVVCTGMGEAAEIIKEQAPTLSQKLLEVERLSLVSTTVFFKRTSEDRQGFGCLFPKSENFFHLGVLYNDCIFWNRSEKYRSETWIGGGALNPTAIKCSDEEILERLLKDRTRVQKKQ